jgi:hypothetical protein
MNGFSLLLTLASLGVVYSWRTGVDQQQEYVLQIEPEIVQALAAGQEIKSDIPPDAGTFQRLCIVILPKDGALTRHTAAGEQQFRQLVAAAGRTASSDRNLLTADVEPTILWPGRPGSNPERSYGVATGWQPDAAGNQEYLVQIDPNVLGSLLNGDELYVPVEPAAGRLVRFIVNTGREKLPRTGGSQQVSLTQNSPAGGVIPPLNGGSSRGGYLGFNDPTATDPRGPQYRQGGAYEGPQSGYGNSVASRQPGSGYSSNDSFAGGSRGFGAPATTSPGYDSYRGQTTANGETMPPPPGYGLQTAANQQPQFNQGQRPFGAQYPETRTAALPTSSGNAANSGVNTPNGYAPNSPQQVQDKPWGPLLFVTFALFFSIGGNLYLAYTALEFHSRYRNAIERLRSAARSS